MKQYAYLDLHRHLDGCISPSIARTLAAMQQIAIPEKEEELKDLIMVSEDCEDLNEYLKRYDFPLELLQTKEALKEATRLILEELKEDGAIYAELRYAPQLHTRKGMSQEEAVLAVLEGLKESPMKANIILCMMRGSDNHDENAKTLELVKKYSVEDGGVVALDMAGAEALYDNEQFDDLFQKAKEYGLTMTIHSGEADGYQNVKSAIAYGAKRIGHGIRSYEDEETLKELKEKKIALEVCPSSNRQTKAVGDMKNYPIMDYIQRGLLVTINTDGPAVSATDVRKEFEYLEKNYGLDEKQREQLLFNSIEAAFTSEKVKEELRERLKESLL